jgi:exocyst complex component 4
MKFPSELARYTFFFTISVVPVLRPAQRQEVQDSSANKVSEFIFSLIDIWNPIQNEVSLSTPLLRVNSEMLTVVRTKVRTLLNDYLTGDEEGVVSARNPIVSVNEVLRIGRFTRDHSKVYSLIAS